MASGPSKSRRLQKSSPKDLNLIPIMNLFIVIIPLLITMWVSVQMAMLQIDMSYSSGGSEDVEETGNAKVDDFKTITVGLFNDYFEIKVEGEENIVTIPVLEKNDQYILHDYVKLDQVISILHNKYPEQEAINILPDQTLEYNVLLKTIDICKYNGFPSINYVTTKTNIINN